MVILAGNIIAHRWNLRKANGKDTITILPCEIVQFRIFRFEPERRATFDFFDHFRWFKGAREGRKDVDMVFYATNDDGLAIMIGKDAAYIMVQFVT